MRRAACPILARTGHGLMSDLSPLSGEERKSNFGAVRSVDDPERSSEELEVGLVRASLLAMGIGGD